MATEKQIAANRLKAQKSTGPSTPEGRAAVRPNSLKNGLTARNLVLPGESEADFEDLAAALEAEHRPTTPTEQVLVEQMIMASWRLSRLYRIEAAFFRFKLEDPREYRDKLYPDLDNDGKHATLTPDAATDRALDHLYGQEARLERSFRSALRQLQRLRGQKPAPAAAASREIGFALQPAWPPPGPIQINTLDLGRTPVAKAAEPRPPEKLLKF